jgi:hypothetical protein
VQSQHDRRAVTMIAVQTPSDFFFVMKNVAFWTAISPRSKKKVRTPWERGESP